MRVLIAGCGYVGSELGVRLARRGHRAWGLRRDVSRLPESIEGVRADLLSPSLADRIPEIESVVYAASADETNTESYRAAYVDGVSNLVEALTRRDAEVKRIVFVSSTAVYGESNGEWVDESTAAAPSGFRGRAVRTGEQIVCESGIPAVILRLAGIYGPGRTQLIERVRSGEARCGQDAPRWSNRVHRDDAAGAIEHVLTLERPEQVYLGVDDEPVPICDVYRHVARLLGVSEPTVAEGPASGGRSNKRCSNRRLRESGYELAFPTYREGYGAILGSG